MYVTRHTKYIYAHTNFTKLANVNWTDEKIINELWQEI